MLGSAKLKWIQSRLGLRIIIIANTWHLFCARPHSKHFTHMSSFTPISIHIIQMRIEAQRSEVTLVKMSLLVSGGGWEMNSSQLALDVTLLPRTRTAGPGEEGEEAAGDGCGPRRECGLWVPCPVYLWGKSDPWVRTRAGLFCWSHHRVWVSGPGRKGFPGFLRPWSWNLRHPKDWDDDW